MIIHDICKFLHRLEGLLGTKFIWIRIFILQGIEISFHWRVIIRASDRTYTLCYMNGFTILNKGFRGIQIQMILIFLSEIFILFMELEHFFHRIAFFFEFRVCLAFFVEFSKPLRNAGFRYIIFRGDAFVRSSFLQMETNNLLFKFWCVTLWYRLLLFFS